jgi:hypothetical protein
MAITTLAAVALGAGALGSAAISSGASGRASRAATEAADQSAAEQRAARDQAYATLNPFIQSGTAANSQINALLGLEQPVQQQMPPMGGYGGYGGMNALGGFDGPRGMFGGQGFGAQGFGGAMRQQPTQQQPGQTTTDRARAAFDQFRNSTGYQFRLGEGMNALNSGYAGAGTIQSGAAMRDAVKYGQDFASNEFGNYMGALGNQQGVGVQSGGAAAGVGIDSANSLSQIYGNRADAIGNASLANAQNINSLIGTGMAGIFKYGVK